MSLTGKRRTLIDPITGEALIPNTTPEAAGAMPKVAGTKGQVLVMGEDNWEAGDVYNSIVESFPVASGMSVHAGDVVDIVQNEVNVNFVSNEPNVLSDIVNYIDNRTAQYYDLVQYGNNDVLMSFIGDGEILYVVHGKVENNSITWDTPQKADSVASSSVGFESTKLIEVSNKTFVLGYMYLPTLSSARAFQSMVITVSDNGIITFSTPSAALNAKSSGSNTGHYNFTMCKIDDTHILLALFSYDKGFYGYIGTISNNAISYSGSTSLSGHYARNVTSAKISNDSSNRSRFIIGYYEAVNYGTYALAVAVDSSYIITVGTCKAVTGSQEMTIPWIYDSENDRVSTIVTWSESSVWYSKYRSFTVDDALTITNAANDNTSVTSVSDSNYSKYAKTISYKRLGDYYLIVNSGINNSTNKYSLLYVLFEIVDNAPVLIDTLEVDLPFTYNYSNNMNLVTNFIVNSTKFISFYVMDGNTKSFAVEINYFNNELTGYLTPITTQAIALQDGSAGDIIKTIFAGTVPFPGITAGTKITSNGVQGYAPLDGILSVLPYWDNIFIKNNGVKIATGSYTGTGTYGSNNPNNLTFDFEPKVVFIFSTGNTYISKPILTSYSDFIVLNSNGTSGYATCGFSHSGNTITWYHYADVNFQLNTSGQTYRYIAIG